MKSKLYLEDVHTNGSHTFGEAEGTRRLWCELETDTGEFIKAAFSMDDLKQACIRADKNPDDIE